ncbi:hypothetical protein NPIL_279921, partial [Nephila pilipes]
RRNNNLKWILNLKSQVTEVNSTCESFRLISIPNPDCERALMCDRIKVYEPTLTTFFGMTET